MGVMGVCVWWGLMGVLNGLDAGGGVARGAGKERGSGWDEEAHTHTTVLEENRHIGGNRMTSIHIICGR